VGSGEDAGIRADMRTISDDDRCAGVEQDASIYENALAEGDVCARYEANSRQHAEALAADPAESQQDPSYSGVHKPTAGDRIQPEASYQSDPVAQLISLGALTSNSQRTHGQLSLSLRGVLLHERVVL
jgi:hypothetical protein